MQTAFLCYLQWMFHINWRNVQKKEFCKQCRYDKFKGTMTKSPVQKPTHRTTQKHAEHHDATDI